MSLIGIDLGTSFIKGAVLNLETYRLEHVQRAPFPEAIAGLPAVYREFDPQQVLAAVREVLASLAPYAEDCEGLLLCSQMHGLICTTEQGEARSNLTTWQDQRVLLPHPSGLGTFFDILQARLTPEELRQLGNELRPGQPVGILFSMVEQNLLPSADLILASLPDFVLANLCQAMPVTELTNAMSHGALNLETLDWHWDVIEKLGLGGLRWPEIKPYGEVVGWLPFGTRRIPCYTPVGDYQCALVGTMLRYDELSLNISTGSQVSLLKPGLEFGDFQTRPFYDGRFLATITHIPAGRALNALVRLLSELAGAQKIALDDPWEYIIQAATDAGPTALEVSLSFYSGAQSSQGFISNIHESELTVGHLFRAAFQSMAENYYSNALRLSPEGTWNKLVFSGGLVQKADILRELICKRFAVDYRMCPTAEDTLLGLLALGLTYTGRVASVTEATDLLAGVYQVDAAS